MVVSLTGLTLIYWIDGWPIQLHLDTSAGRVVASVVVGAAIVSPIFLTQALDFVGAQRLWVGLPQPLQRQDHPRRDE